MTREDNPYAPPKALNLEPAPEPAADQCAHVEWACKLLWIGFGFSLLDVLVEAFYTRGSEMFGVGLVGNVIGLVIALAIVFWFTIKLRAGRNWMRLLITILTVVGLATVTLVFIFIEDSASIVDAAFRQSPILAASSAVQMTLSVTEAVLINTPASRAWFRAHGFRADA